MQMPPSLKTYFRVIGVLAIGAVIADTMVSGKFGLTLGLDMMMIMAGASIASGYLLVIAAFLYLINHSRWSAALTGVWAVAFAFNVVSNMGVAGGNRTVEVQQAAFVKAKHDEAITGKEEQQKKYELLQKTRADAIQRRGWTAARPVAELEREIAAYPGINAHIWRRTKECTDATIPASVAYCQQYATLKADLAIAKEVAALDKRIEAAKRGMDNARAAIAAMDPGISHAAAQSGIIAKLFSASLGSQASDKAVAIANDGLGIGAAIVLAILSAALTLVGAWPALLEARAWWSGRSSKGDEPEADPLPKPGTFGHSAMPVSVPQIAPAAQAPAPQVGFIPQPSATHERIIERPIMDPRLARLLAEATRHFRPAAA